MDCSPAKKRRLMERLPTTEPMEVDPPESSEEPMDVDPPESGEEPMEVDPPESCEEPMEVDLVPGEEPMEVDPPPPGQSHQQLIALRKRQRRARARACPYYWRGLRSCPPPRR